MKMPKIPQLPKLQKRTWALIVAVLLILAAIPALGVVRFTTSHPFFCMRSFGDVWQSVQVAEAG